MTDSLSDDARLRATEAQMRRALGLHNTTPMQAATIPPTTSPGASSPQRRRFVRDGEVPVSLLHRDRDGGAGTNKLDATRPALREQVEARERAEHLLQEAEATVRDLQTKLAHERIAHEEAVRRMEGEMQAVEQALQRVQDELATERGCRQKAEQERDDAIAARQEAEERLRDAMESKEAPEIPVAPSPVRSARRATHAGPTRVATNPEPVAGEEAKAGRMVPPTDAGTTSVKQPRRRGRPPKAEPLEEFVEWWKPGWHERFR